MVVLDQEAGEKSEATLEEQIKPQPLTKNQKKKQKKNQNKNRREKVEALMKRNVSEIKGPKQLEENGQFRYMRQIELKNHNYMSKYNCRDRRSDDSESDSSESSEDDNDVEEIEDYQKDGYHPAHVGEIIDSKYVVLKKLGWGHFSTVWLAFKLSDKQLYALKI